MIPTNRSQEISYRGLYSVIVPRLLEAGEALLKGNPHATLERRGSPGLDKHSMFECSFVGTTIHIMDTKSWIIIGVQLDEDDDRLETTVRVFLATGKDDHKDNRPEYLATMRKLHSHLRTAENVRVEEVVVDTPSLCNLEPETIDHLVATLSPIIYDHILVGLSL